jgi:hypothetical protein
LPRGPLHRAPRAPNFNAIDAGLAFSSAVEFTEQRWVRTRTRVELSHTSEGLDEVAQASSELPTAAPDDGRIPFRLRIGVTGHRQTPFETSEPLYRVLDRLVEHLRSDRSDPNTKVELAVVSQLAEGSDRVVVQQVFEYATAHGCDARLEVVLPLQQEQYVDVQNFSTESREEFDRWLAASTFRLEPPRLGVATHEDRANAYAAAGDKLIARCDVLIALWDGKPAAGRRGGTAHTLLNAAARRKPCVWIPVEPGEETSDNLEPGSARPFYELVRTRSRGEPDHEPDSGALDEPVLGPMLQAYEALDEYNREPRPRRAAERAHGVVQRLAAGVLDRTVDRRFERGFDAALSRSIERRIDAGTPAWLAPPSSRASLLAVHYRRWFKRLSSLVLIAATLGAMVLAVGVAAATRSALWPGLELAFLMLALIAFLVVRSSAFHRRWLSYRVLAERFRTARYLASTGVDFREQARLHDVAVGDQSEVWLMRAFEEVWDREPDRQPDESELEALKRLLADEWVHAQIEYHRNVTEAQDRLKRRLTVTAYVAFALTLGAAATETLLVAIGAAERPSDIAKALTILLPALGASVGAALTINQPTALAQRSAKMQADLRIVQAEIRAAADMDALIAAAASAVQLIAPEAGSWFGALWFLDLEHP